MDRRNSLIFAWCNPLVLRPFLLVVTLTTSVLATSQEAYLKALNSEGWDRFGISVAISGDTAIVGAHEEDGSARGVNGDGELNSAEDSGAAYIYVRDSSGQWTQQAYLKASNADAGDNFGESVAISGDIAVVGAKAEMSDATGINGNQNNNSATYAGAAYVFVRDASGNWSQQAYLKASNNEGGDTFGCSVAVSGQTVVIGAAGEKSNATGINGNQANNQSGSSGAAYVFVQSRRNVWTQQAYLKASNNNSVDAFGVSVAVSGDMAVVGAVFEDSAAKGVNGNEFDNGAASAGAAYVFVRNSSRQWSQEAYLKASNTDAGDRFGEAVAIDGETVLIGARWEDSIAKGVNGDEEDNSLYSAGAAYVFARNEVGSWYQQAYLKPSNTDAYDFYFFGTSVAVSGNDLIVGAPGEGGSSTGIDGDQYHVDGWWNGAAYQFRRDQHGTWTQQAYIKSSNERRDDRFATSIAVSDGTAIVGAIGEDSAATGVDGDQNDFKTNGEWVGASYIFDLKPQNPEIRIVRSSMNGSEFTLHFTGGTGLEGWVLSGGTDLVNFPDTLLPMGPVLETAPGHYEVSVDLGPSPPGNYFLRISR